MCGKEHALSLPLIIEKTMSPPQCLTPHYFFPKGKVTNLTGQLLKHLWGPVLKVGGATVLWREDGAAPTVLPLCNSEVIFLLILLVQGKYSWALGAPTSPLLLVMSVGERSSWISRCKPDLWACFGMQRIIMDYY